MALMESAKWGFPLVLYSSPHCSAVTFIFKKEIIDYVCALNHLKKGRGDFKLVSTQE